MDQENTLECHLLSNNIVLDLSRQSLGTKLHTPSNTNPYIQQVHTKMYCMCPHTRREHEHATHPQDVRKWGLLPSLTLSRLGLKPGLFTAFPSLPCNLVIYSPIISLSESSCSSQDDKQQSFQWLLLWLCDSNLFSHPVCSERICDHTMLFSQIYVFKNLHFGSSRGMLSDDVGW